MRELRIQPGRPSGHLRMMIVGPPSSGKTTMAASAPKPLFICDSTEGGWATIESMDPNLWWDPNVPPEVWIVEKAMPTQGHIGDTNEMLQRLERMAAQGNFPYSTVVIDPISIYADRIVSELQLAEAGRDNRQVYGDLANHLRVIFMRFHALPCHVMWLSHINRDGGLAVAGQMSDKIPALCDYKWLTWVDATNPLAPPRYELHTKPFQKWTFIGGRGPELPNPMVPSFKVVAQILKLPQQPVSPAVPGYPQGCVYDWPPQQQVPAQ